MGDRHFAKAKVSLELSKSCVEVKRDGVACMYEQNIYIVIQALVAALLAIKGGYHVFQKNCLHADLKYTDYT